MATAKKTTTKKTVKSVKINFQSIGSLPEEVTVKAGTTLADFVADRNIKDYVVSLNASTSASNSTVLAKGDVIRIAPKTKNA